MSQTFSESLRSHLFRDNSMNLDPELDGLFNQNTTYDYKDYEYKEDPDPSVSKQVWIPLLYSLVMVAGLLGNGLLMAALVLKRRAPWTASDTFIFHQSLADILLLLMLPLWVVQGFQSCRWCFAGALCNISGAVLNMNFYCGIFLLTIICLDRYLSVVHHKVMLSNKKPSLTLISCIVVWLCSLILTIPDFIFTADWNDPPDEKTLCVHRYPHIPIHRRLVVRLHHHILGFLLPTATLVICCSSVLFRLHRISKGFQKHRSILVILSLVVVFLLCWVPHNITLIVDTHRRKAEATKGGSAAGNPLDMALLVTSIFGCVHASLRPLLYIGLSANFRKWCVAMLKCTTAKLESSLCELGVGEETPSEQRHEEVEQVPMTAVDHQVQSGPDDGQL